MHTAASGFTGRRRGKSNTQRAGKNITKGKERKGKERKGKERKGKGKERKGKERKGKERKGKLQQIPPTSHHSHPAFLQRPPDFAGPGHRVGEEEDSEIRHADVERRVAEF